MWRLLMVKQRVNAVKVGRKEAILGISKLFCLKHIKYRMPLSNFAPPFFKHTKIKTTLS